MAGSRVRSAGMSRAEQRTGGMQHADVNLNAAPAERPGERCSRSLTCGCTTPVTHLLALVTPAINCPFLPVYGKHLPAKDGEGGINPVAQARLEG